MRHIDHHPIDVYPVGVLAAWKHRRMRGKLRYERRYLIDCLRQRKWRAIRMAFGGYHAEVDSTWRATRCGHGWTKKRAVADLHRHLESQVRETLRDQS